jgi:hypothetical protein
MGSNLPKITYLVGRSSTSLAMDIWVCRLQISRALDDKRTRSIHKGMIDGGTKSWYSPTRSLVRS